MLIAYPYSLLPAFTLASFLIILLWPENISFRNRLRFFIGIVLIWIAATMFAINGYGANEMPLVCLINLVVGLLGLIALFFTHTTKPSR